MSKSDVQLPRSGLWRGYYVQDGSKYPFEMELLFNTENKVSGKGKDGIGEFSINGKVSQENRSMEFIKQYIGKHSISYEATYNQTGTYISGMYEGLDGFQMNFFGTSDQEKMSDVSSQPPRSGLWRGHYLQYRELYPFELKLQFDSDAKLSGAGNDGIGQFSIDGSWSQEERSMKFVKQYIGKHSIPYEATYDDTGTYVTGLYSGSGYFTMDFVKEKQEQSSADQKPQSGQWSGYYVQDETKHKFDMELLFSSQAKVTGTGSDGIGEFTIDGTWSQEDRSMKFTKQYIGKHSISYEATFDDTGEYISGLYFGTGYFKMEFLRDSAKGQQLASGTWRGQYEQGGEEHSFEMKLEFDIQGIISGSGDDEIGKFSIDGKWSQENKALEFTKQYIGKHSIPYEGTYDTSGYHISGLYLGTGKFQMDFLPEQQQQPRWGLWRGYYVQSDTKHSFELRLLFGIKGKMTGWGSDEIGKFSIEGKWLQETRSMEFIKQYIGKHSIPYEATCNGTGRYISGLYQGSGYFQMNYEED